MFSLYDLTLFVILELVYDPVRLDRLFTKDVHIYILGRPLVLSVSCGFG